MALPSLTGWQKHGLDDFTKGLDARPPENSYARSQYWLGWSAGQDSQEALDLRAKALS